MSTIGLNISGGEFGGTAGVHNSQYHYPTYNELKFYADKGVDLIRVPFRWERVQDALGGPLDLSGDLALIKQVLVDAAALGMDVILDCHNYGRFKGVALGAVGGPTAEQFADFWQKMAAELKDYPALAGYDLMNEPHDMPTSTIWKESAQAATDAIREVDMSNTIIIEGTAWAGAHSWLKYNSDLIINDPANNIVYQAHQYFDDDSSGTYGETYAGEAADPMVGVRRLEPFVAWLEANNLKGMIGETGVPSDDPRWIEVMKNSLDYMIQNNLDVTLWAGGAWWGETYPLYVAKPGAEDSAFGDLLEQYYNKFDGFDTQGPTASYNTPTVKIGDAVAGEGGTLTFTVTRSGNLSGTSVVNYSTAKGIAIAGSDFTTKTGTLTFAAGETTKMITVAVLSDGVLETPETMKVNITAGSNVRIFDALGLGTITDIAPLVPVVAISDATIDEAAGTMTFTVTRSGTVTGSSSVSFATADGTATAGTDYVATSGTLNFAAGETVKTITVSILNDTAVEGPEAFTVKLTVGTNVSLLDGTGTGTVNSDDVNPGTIMGTDATETINGTSGADSIYALDGHDTIMGSGAADYIDGGIGGDQINYVSSNAAVNVDLARALQQGGHAEGDQLVSIAHLSGSAYNDVLAGSDSANDINGNGGQDVLTGRGGADRFIFDSAAEANGDLITDYSVDDKLDFSRLGTSIAYWLSNDGVKTTVFGDTNGDGSADFRVFVNGVHASINGVTFQAPPPPPPPTVTIGDVTVNENAGTMTFTITRAGSLTAASSVNYATANGTAIAGSDFASITGTASFAAGETVKTVTVSIINDNLVETAETLMLNLTAGTNVTITDAQGIGTINSDDVTPPPPAPTVTIGDVTVNENAGTMTFTITRTGSLTAASSVNFATANGTATAGSDYAAITGTASFAAGEAVKTVTVSIINDTSVETAETLMVNLTGGVNVTISDAQGIGTINSEDIAVPVTQPTTPTVTTVDGTNAEETIRGTSGTDIINGKGGDDIIYGSAGADQIFGGSGLDTVSYHGSGAAVNVDLTRSVQQGGDAEGDQLNSVGDLIGSAHNDILSGNHWANDINGNAGEDVLTGHSGKDRFIFDTAEEANGDFITDFSNGFDQLDLQGIDANNGVSGDQTFNWLDTGAFTGAAGQLREYSKDGKLFLAGDTNGDRVADFVIEVAGTTNLTSNDIIF